MRLHIYFLTFSNIADPKYVYDQPFHKSQQVSPGIKGHLPYLLADEPLLAWSTNRLDGASNVDGPELIVRSTRLMFIQSGFADADDGVDGWLTNAAQVGSDAVLLSIAECS